MPSKTALTKITQEQIEEYLRLEEERKELERKASAIARKTKAYADEFKAALQAYGKTSAVKHGYRLTLDEVAGRVMWKEAYIEKEGPLAAAKLMEEAPKGLKLTVQKAV